MNPAHRPSPEVGQGCKHVEGDEEKGLGGNPQKPANGARCFFLFGCWLSQLLSVFPCIDFIQLAAIFFFCQKMCVHRIFVASF